jgi:hypothetical protein
MQSANPPSLTGGIGNQCPLPQQAFLNERHWQFRQENLACQPGGNIGVGEHCDLECSPGYQRASGEETLRCDAHILPFAEPAEPLLECEEIQDIDYDNLDREAEDLTPYRPENWERPNQIASNLNYGVDDRFGEHRRSFANHLTADIPDRLRESDDGKLTFPFEWLKLNRQVLTQGQRGFNDYMMGVILKAFRRIGLMHFNNDVFQASCPDLDQPREAFPALQPYQLLCKYACTPETERIINRFLVAHGVGTGKTLTMIEIAANYTADAGRRPILFVVPRAVKNRLLQEMCRFRSIFRDKLDEWDEPTVRRAADGDEEALDQVHRALKRKIFDRLPMRVDIMSFSEAGSSARSRQSTTLARGTNDRRLRTVDFREKIILCDEAHLQLRSSMARQIHQRRRQVRAVATKCSRARATTYNPDGTVKQWGSVIFMFTATPVGQNPADVLEMMNIIRGEEDPHKQFFEGYLSYFIARPTSIFPRHIPAGNLPEFVEVPLKGTFSANNAADGE